MSKYLDNDGLLYFWQKIKTLLAGKVDTVSGKGLSTNDYTTTEKEKLASIAAGAQVNPAVVSKSADGLAPKLPDETATTKFLRQDGTWNVPAPYSLPTASASTKGGVKIGSGLTMTGEVLSANTQTTNDFTDAYKDKLDGISDGANAYSLPTASASAKGGVKIGSGLTMTGEVLSANTQTANDFTDTYKNKLDHIDEGANNYAHVRYTAKASGLYKITVDAEGHVSATSSVASSDLPSIAASKITTGTLGAARLPAASASAQGAMSAAHYSKLAALPTNATLESTYAKKTDLTSMYRHKGSVATVADLPASATAGDVYNVTATGMNYVWVDSTTGWDALGEVFSIDAITNSEIDTILAS